MAEEQSSSSPLTAVMAVLTSWLENNNKRINTILSELQKKTYKAGTIEQKLSDFYKLSMDVDSRNKAGIAQ